MFMIFLVYSIVSLFNCVFILSPSHSYSYGTIWPVFAETAVKHQSTNSLTCGLLVHDFLCSPDAPLVANLKLALDERNILAVSCCRM